MLEQTLPYEIEIGKTKIEKKEQMNEYLWMNKLMNEGIDGKM